MKPTKVADLKKHEKNPRKITATQRHILDKTLEQFGDLSGIVFNRSNGRLVGGHQRQDWFNGDEVIEISERFEKPTKQGTVAIGTITKNGEKFSYREVEWPETTHLAAMIAANKGGGEWDIEKLGQAIDEVSQELSDIEFTGFEADEITAFISRAAKDLDYSVLEEGEALDEKIEEMTKGVRKALMIDFAPGDYEEAYLLAKFFRDRGDYLGGMIVNFLKEEKEYVEKQDKQDVANAQ